MNAPIFSDPPKTDPLRSDSLRSDLAKSVLASSWFNRRPVGSTDRPPSRHLMHKASFERSLDRFAPVLLADGPDLAPMWGRLLELLPQGVIVVSRNFQPVYWNLKADTLCRSLSVQHLASHELPALVSEVCHKLVRDHGSTHQPLVMECQVATGQTMRISARWLCSDAFAWRGAAPAAEIGNDPGSSQMANWQAYILVFVENCTDALKEEMVIEQKKYDLTEREAEIWMLLRQEYTYQEIAKMLQISLNTVKTHVKNVYAKRRSFLGQDKFWCSQV